MPCVTAVNVAFVLLVMAFRNVKIHSLCSTLQKAFYCYRKTGYGLSQTVDQWHFFTLWLLPAQESLSVAVHHIL